MKLIHENVKMFDKMAENVNYAMSNISATLVDEVRKGWPNFHWTPKEQSALVAQVTMGDKTLMTTGEKEWRGFDGEQAVHFLLSLKKLDWAKKAQPGILRNVSQIVEPLVEDPLLDALLYSGKSLTITKQYGMLSYKSLWRVTGKLATAKEFHLKGAGQAAVERLRKQIRDAEEGTDRKYGQEYLESRPLAGNAYIEDMQERLNEQIAKMDGREIAFETWQGDLGDLVAFNNAMADWVDDPDAIYKLPDGSGLDDYLKAQRMSIHTRLVDTFTMDKQNVAIMEALEADTLDAMSCVDALMEGTSWKV